MPRKNFADRLMGEIDRKAAPVCVGIDPRLGLLPQHIRNKALKKSGASLASAASAYLEFSRRIIDAVTPHIPAVKLQVAFFELLGWEGIKAYRKIVDYAHDRGLLVIGDIKRSDIGTSARAYARAHLGEVRLGRKRFRPWDEDAVTVNAYLGSDGIQPFIAEAAKAGKGVFVLLRTSNPSASEIQDLKCRGKPLYLYLAGMIKKWGAGGMGERGYSAIGAVVAANRPEDAKRLRKIMPKNYFLMPGYGAQGAAARDVIAGFNKDGYGGLITASRSIIYAYREPHYKRFGPRRWPDAVQSATLEMKQAINEALESNI